jgi:hypothetical protein
MSRSNHRPSPSMLVALVAVFLSLGGVGVAATGGNFILGQSNSADAPSVLTGNAGTNPQLRIDAAGGGPALSAVVRAGVPPFKVNSSAKVAGLNADLVDGIDSSDLLIGLRGVTSSNQVSLPNDQATFTTIASTSFTLRTSSPILLLGEASVGYTGTAALSTAKMRVLIDGKAAGGSVFTQPGATDSVPVSIPVNVLLAGSHTFVLQVNTFATDGTFTAGQRSLSVLTRQP